MPDLTVFSGIRFFNIPFPRGYIHGEGREDLGQRYNFFS
jgi:hypothetical protein